MLRVHCPVDCGNAPRKEFLRDFNVAFVQGDVDAVLDSVHDDIVWEIIGGQRIQGKDELRRFLHGMQERKRMELHIHHIITHGTEAAVNGTIMMTDGGQYALCDIYVFAGASKTAKLKAMISYGTAISDVPHPYII